MQNNKNENERKQLGIPLKTEDLNNRIIREGLSNGNPDLKKSKQEAH